jgi:hypothetical protein
MTNIKINLTKHNSYKKGLLQSFSSENSLQVTIKDSYPEQEYYYQYADDFDYNDGEANGNIYFFDENLEIVCIKTIYGGDYEDYEFTELGVSLLKKELVDYFYWLVNRI